MKNKSNHMMQKKRDFIDKKKKLYIFGAGENAKKIYNILLEQHARVHLCAFADNNPDKWGKRLFDKKIISADELKKEVTQNDIILLSIMSVDACEEVKAQLLQMGIDQNLIFLEQQYFELLAEETIKDIRERGKGNKGIIRVGFLTQEVQSWDKTAPVYKAMKESEKFEAYLFVVPYMNFKNMELTRESQLEVFKALYPADHVLLASEETDISDYHLDYLFMTAPYDGYYPNNLRSDYLVTRTLLCYIPYGYNGAYNFISNNTDRDFFRNIYIIFTDAIEIKDQLLDYFQDSVDRKNKKILDIGYPSLECIFTEVEETVDDGTIMWTPRWSYDPKIGGSHFFEYYDCICNIKKKYPERKLVFRPHPMMFDNFLREGRLRETDVNDYRKAIADSGIFLDEGSDAHLSLKNTSILITDFSTLIMQFFMTGKPIIYCASELISLNCDYAQLMKAIYVAENQTEIEKALFEIIENGDPLKEAREKIRKSVYHKQKGTINRILRTLEQDSGRRVLLS